VEIVVAGGSVRCVTVRAGGGWGRRPTGRGRAWALGLVRLGRGRPGEKGKGARGGAWPAGPAQSVRLFFFRLFLFFYFFLSFKNAFEHLNRIGKIRIIYRWIPCKKAITLKPFLKQK
jgi:hypothetical protein